MGMTDRQFDAFISGIVRELKRAEEEIQNQHQSNNKTIEELRKDLEAQLKRP